MAQTPDFSLDASALVREESFTDNRAGMLRVLTPVTADGTIDSSRSVQYQGQVQVMTPMGPLPIHFDIEASSFAEAVALFGEKAQAGLEQTLKELEEMRRQQQSAIVVPGQGAMGAPTGGMGGGFNLR